MSTEAPAALRADACPEPELLAAYIDGQLSPGERTQVERHLAGCAECRDIVGESFRALTEIPSAPVRRPARVRWVAVAGGLVATAAAILVVVRLQGPGSVDWKPLLTADGQRPIDARLSIMSSYAPPPVPTRGTTSRNVSADARIVAMEVQRRAEANRSGATLHDAGMARLLVGDPAAAVESLEQAAAATPTAAVLSDLSAALLVEATQRGDAPALDRARTAARKALEADPRFVPALFNAALTEEAAGAPTAAIDLWQRYLALDADSSWAAEAREHVDRLRRQG